MLNCLRKDRTKAEIEVLAYRFLSRGGGEAQEKERANWICTKT